MNCQDVTEFMHRYVDRDLSAADEEVMRSHILACPECAAVFDRLVKLSAELEQLPKVVPAFSLVDAILPQLNDVEIGRMESSSAEELKAGLPYDDDAGEGAQTVRSFPRKRKSGWLSWRLAGGAVTAGILAAIVTMAIQGGGDSHQNADMISASTASKKSVEESAGAPASAPKADGAADQSTGAAAESTDKPIVMFEAVEPTTNDKVKKAPMAAAEAAPTPTPRAAAKSLDSHAPAARTFRAEANSEPPATDTADQAKAMATPPPIPLPSSGISAPHTKEAGPTEPEAVTPSPSEQVQNKGFASLAKPSASPTASPEATVSSTVTPASTPSPVSSMQPSPEPSGSPIPLIEWVSNDRSYVAVLLQGSVVVKDQTRTKELFRSTRVWTDKDQVSFEWSDDSKRLKYMVVQGADGKTRNFVIDMTERTEVEEQIQK